MSDFLLSLAVNTYLFEMYHTVDNVPLSTNYNFIYSFFIITLNVFFIIIFNAFMPIISFVVFFVIEMRGLFDFYVGGLVDYLYSIV